MQSELLDPDFESDEWRVRIAMMETMIQWSDIDSSFTVIRHCRLILRVSYANIVPTLTEGGVVYLSGVRFLASRSKWGGPLAKKAETERIRSHCGPTHGHLMVST